MKPPKLAGALMTWREELAEEWQRELHALATATDATYICSSEMAHAQLLEGLATRIALREMLHDLRLRPSQATTSAWLSAFLTEHQTDLEAGGSVAQLLADLRAEPLMIRCGTLFDPLQLADEVRERTVLIERDMATLLESTCGEHQLLRSNFLERCLEH